MLILTVVRNLVQLTKWVKLDDVNLLNTIKTGNCTYLSNTIIYYVQIWYVEGIHDVDFEYGIY